MSSHYHEHHRELLRWSWKLFCAKWARLFDHLERERAKDAERERQAAWDKLRAAHDGRVASGISGGGMGGLD